MPVHAFVRFLRQRPLFLLVIKVFRVWRRSGLSGLRWRKRLLHHQSADYGQWLQIEHERMTFDCDSLAEEIDDLQNSTLISIIMPVCDPPERWLRNAIDSVRSQLYQNWQLCIADDASTLSYVRPLLESLAAGDDRIHVAFRHSRGHICAATKTALELTTGEFVTFLDHDDELSSIAIARVAAEISRYPEVDLLYSDEDLIGVDGRRYDPYFKPDWNPELLCAQNYLCHLSIYRADLLHGLDVFRSEVQGSQDWDLALRASERARCIRHIPYVLYHWRTIPGSTAHSDEAKRYALTAGRSAVQQHLVRTGENAEVIQHEFGHLRVRRSLQNEMPCISLIISTDSASAIARHLEALQHYPRHSDIEVLFATTKFHEDIELPKECRIINVVGDEVLSQRLNRAGVEARGDVLCFMGDCCEAIDAAQLELLVLEAIRPEVGAVGVRLLSPDGRILHAGYFLDPESIVLHPYRGAPSGFAGQRNRAILQQNISAVSASCLAVKRTLFEQLNGFEKASSHFFDVDFCLRLLEMGLRNVWTPYVSVILHNLDRCKNRGDGRMNEEGIRYMRSRWEDILACDPAGNPNLIIVNGLPVPGTRQL